MQNNPYSPQPYDSSGQIPPTEQAYFADQTVESSGQEYPRERYQPGFSPSPPGQGAPMQPQYPPAQPVYPMQQPYPPAQSAYPGQQPYPQAPQPNQTYVVVNNSQKVNSGCGPWVWIVLVGLVVLVLGCVGLPLLMGGSALLYRSSNSNQQTAVAGTPIIGTMHNKVNQAVDVKWQQGYTRYHEKITVTAIKAITKQDAAGRDMVISLSTAALDGDTSYADSTHFYLADTAGQSYKSDFLGEYPRYSGDLAPGNTVNGAIAFQIPPGKHIFTLTFSPTTSGVKGPLYGWDIRL